MYLFSEKFNESVSTLERLKAKGQEHPEIIRGGEPTMYRMLGRSYYGLKDYARSEKQYKLALQKEPVPKSSSVVFTNVRLAETYWRWGKKEKAMQCIELAEAMSKQVHFKEREPDIARLKEVIMTMK